MVRIKTAFLLVLLMALIPLSAYSLKLITITSPADKTKTLSTRTSVAGKVEGTRQLDVNGTKIEVDGEGKFSALALLKPGKNLILVTAKYGGGRQATARIRLLRLISCDDLDEWFKKMPPLVKQQMLTLLTLGIIEGYPDNTFLPGTPLSRGEFATWLAKAKGLKMSQVTSDVFYDVPKEHWRAQYVKAVVDAGYMTGVATDESGIGDLVKRGDAVALIARAGGLVPVRRIKTPFADVPPGTKDAFYITAAYEQGWISGYPGKVRKLEPDKDITRGDAAILLSKIPKIRELRAGLFNFEEGYTAYQFSKINTKPVINAVSAEPVSIAADGKTPLKLSVKVTDADGLSDISQVWADLTPLGGPNDAKMNLMTNKLFEINFIITTDTTTGEKRISVGALDKSGLKAAPSSVRITVISEKQ